MPHPMGRLWVTREGRDGDAQTKMGKRRRVKGGTKSRREKRPSAAMYHGDTNQTWSLIQNCPCAWAHRGQSTKRCAQTTDPTCSIRTRGQLLKEWLCGKTESVYLGPAVTPTLRFTEGCPSRAKGALPAHFPKGLTSLPSKARAEEEKQPSTC